VLPVLKGSANYGGIKLWNRYYDNATDYSAKLLSNGKYLHGIASMEQSGLGLINKTSLFI
jgi:hypothetical protein